MAESRVRRSVFVHRVAISSVKVQDKKVMNDKVKTKNVVMTDPEELRQMIGAVGVAESDSKKAKEALSIVYDALNSSVNGIIITDLQGEIHYVNPAFLRMFRYKEGEIIGRNAAALFPSESVKKFADVKAIIDDNRGETEEFISRRKDGSEFLVEVSSSNVTNREGNIIGRMASLIDITERRKAEKAVQKSTERISVLSSRLLQAEDRERKRIAKDIHDILGSSLTAIKYMIEKQIDEMGHSAVQRREGLKQVVAMVRDAIKETKRISRSLRPAMLDDLGLLATINWGCREFNNVYSHIRVEKTLEIQEEIIPESLKSVIYKLLHEALNNAAKHSGASLVRLFLRKKEGRIELAVEDNGQGFCPEAMMSSENLDHRMGLVSMKERAELFGGTFAIESSTGRGTTILASWPCG
jgi:PAS domain S-box-containing protein